MQWFFSADTDMCLLPLKAKGRTRVIIKKVHIPPHRPETLEYFEYNTTQYKLEGLFKVRTTKSVQELKNSPGFMDFLNTNRIWLKHT